MLQINMADVMNVIGSLTPYLIAIGVLFALALIITFAVNKKTVKDVATRKIVHSESWLVALVGIVVAVSMMLTGPLSTLLNNATITKYMLSDATVSKANDLAKEVQSEAITMLKNDDSNLPLSNKKVNVFGWGSTNPVYGGTGSGSMSDQYDTVSLLDGMKEAGIETNADLTKLYTDYRADRPVVGMFAQDWTLPEVPAKQYSDKLVSDAKDFSDEAVVVLTRVGGEGADLPTDMKAKGITYKNNSKDYDDFQKGESFLQLSKTERDMIDLVTSNFKKVTLVYNGANAFQFDFLSQYPQIKSVLWCPPAGQTGFSALGDVLAGEDVLGGLVFHQTTAGFLNGHLGEHQMLVQCCDGSLGDDTVNLLLIELFEIVKSLQALLDQSVDLSLGCGELLFRSRLGRLFLLLCVCHLKSSSILWGIAKVFSVISIHLAMNGALLIIL